MAATTTDEFVASLAEILQEIVGTDPAEVRLDALFVDDLLVDSLSMIEVIVAVEQKFGVVVPDEDVKTLRTVQDAVAEIERKTAAS